MSTKLKQLQKPLPTATRPGKGGKEFTYVPVAFVVNRIIDVFGLDWDFEVVKEIVQQSEAVVLVRITYTGEDGKPHQKQAWGGKSTSGIGLTDALKAATSLALKKAAELLGITVPDEDTPASEEQVQEVKRLMEARELEWTDALAAKAKAMTYYEIAALIEQLSNA